MALEVGAGIGGSRTIEDGYEILREKGIGVHKCEFHEMITCLQGTHISMHKLRAIYTWQKKKKKVVVVTYLFLTF